jgi:hypothetical protein
VATPHAILAFSNCNVETQRVGGNIEMCESAFFFWDLKDLSILRHTIPVTVKF